MLLYPSILKSKYFFASITIKEINRLFIQGDRNLRQGNYTTAITIFEQLYNELEPSDRDYFNIQRSLVKAYQQNEQKEDAIALCQQQEDCVYGTIGTTDIFFAEIIVQKVARNERDNPSLDNIFRKSTIFKGLFFEAQFAKNFIGRTFILPNDFPGKIATINNWRGELIQLEDPDQNQYKHC